MKIRAWQVMMIKRMVRQYLENPSVEVFEECLKELATKSNKPQETIAIFNCTKCGKRVEKSYSVITGNDRKQYFKERKLYCSFKCAQVNNVSQYKAKGREYVKLNKMGKEVNERYS